MNGYAGGLKMTTQKELYSIISENFPDAKIREGMDLEHRFLEKDVDIKVFFENGYGASIVRGRYTYGRETGNFEIAVLECEDEYEFELTFETPITDDVIPNADVNETIEVLKKIQEL